MVGTLVLSVFVALAPAAQDRPLDVVPQLDPQRYAGTWYEIARLPNRFQRDCAGDVTATYTPKSNGRFEVRNRCRKADGSFKSAKGVARHVEGRPASVLEVRFAPAFLSFLPMVWGDYQVIALGDDYEYTMIGSPNRKYLWVLARKPHMDQARYESLLAQARAQGFDTSRMIKTEHGTGTGPNSRNP